MKIRYLLAILAIVFLAACAGKNAETPAAEPTAETPKETIPTAPAAPAEPTETAPAASTTEVMVSKEGFSPAMLTVSAGSTVTWKVTDTNSHSISAVGGSFRSGSLRGEEASYSYTFETAGEYEYMDAVYKSNKGKVVVE